METINFWPIIVASIVAFGIGALWYSPVLFGKEWMSLTKMSDADIALARTKGMTKLYVTQFVMTIITFIIMAFAIALLGSNGRDGAMIGLLAWIGFTLPTGVSGFLWENKPIKLVLITSIGTLICLVIGGAIIGVWN